MDINKVNSASSTQIKAFSPTNVEDKQIEQKVNINNSNSYISPTIRVDIESGMPISVFRDTKTGEIEREFPSKEVIQKYKETVG